MADYGYSSDEKQARRMLAEGVPPDLIDDILKYRYGKVKILARRMAEHGVAPEVIAQVMEGGGEIGQRTATKKKHAWLKQAMDKMDALIEQDLRQVIREECACCLGGKRGKLSKAIGQDHDTLEERIAAANETPYVFGHSVTLLDDGRVQVMFDARDKESYRCVCLGQAEMPVSETYCYCCGGHVKHHLQQALVRELECAVVETALTSAGQAPCTFRFTLLD